MSVCAKPNRTRKPYTYTADNPNALLYNKSTWTPDVSGDVNFDNWGAASGFPPQQLTLIYKTFLVQLIVVTVVEVNLIAMLVF